MRISRRIQLAGLVALAGAGAAPEAVADDLTISTSTTSPVFTATAAGAPPSAGDVTVASGGTITIGTAGQTAITVNSNNDVSNAGVLTGTNLDNTGGIRLQDTFSGTITNTGQINFSDGYTLTDGNSDGDLDGAWATGSGRFGILLEPGAFTGNIVSSGSISVEGVGSYGIVLNGLLDGDGATTGNLTASGTITVIGDDSVAVAILGGAAGGVAGDVDISSNITAFGEDAIGLLIDAPVDGEVRLAGTWDVTGLHSMIRVDDTNLEGDDLLIGGPAVAIHQNIADGLIIQGIGLEDDDDDDGDGQNDEADDNRGALITSFGSEPALLIQNQGASILDISAGVSGYGVEVLGTIIGRGVQDNIEATAIRIESTSGSAVTTALGLRNEGVIRSQAFEANSTAIHIGADASVPTIANLNAIQAEMISEGADTVTAILIESGATDVSTLENSGSIVASLNGEAGDAVAVRDLSGTLTTINNSNTIGAVILATDDDLLDGITPVVTGSAIAIDVQNASSSVTVTQSDNADTEVTEQIVGDILLGAYADVVDLQAGAITGDISFGNGADEFYVDGGATFTGMLTDGDDDLYLNVQDGTVSLTGGNARLSGADFGGESALVVTLSGVLADPPVVEVLGAATFAPGATVHAITPSGLVEGSEEFLTALSMSGGDNVVCELNCADAPFIYNFSITLTDPDALDGAANGLVATYELKDADDLNMTENQGAALDPIIAALQLDDRASAAIVAITNEEDFFDAYEDLMPSYASASAELATTAIQQSQSATSNRLAATRLQGLNEVSAWVQEIGYSLTREPPTANGQAFDGHGFGVAMGIDGPLDNGAMFGLSASFIASEAEEEGRPDGEISASLGQLNAYFGTAMGPLDIDLIGGLGAGQLQSRRFVQIGDTFGALSEAEWWAYEGHGAVRISAPMSAGWVVVTPQAALTYVYMSEEGYTEEGGGEAIDYEVGDATSQRLWGDVGVEFSGRFEMGRGAIIAPRLFAGYRANLLDEEAERSFRFVSGTDEFTLTDESLGDGAPLIGIGLDATNGFSTVAIGYEGEFGDQIERHSLNVGVRFRF